MRQEIGILARFPLWLSPPLLPFSCWCTNATLRYQLCVCHCTISTPSLLPLLPLQPALLLVPNPHYPFEHHLVPSTTSSSSTLSLFRYLSPFFPTNPRLPQRLGLYLLSSYPRTSQALTYPLAFLFNLSPFICLCCQPPSVMRLGLVCHHRHQQ